MSGLGQAARAEVLSEALPHIRKYNKKTVVIKYGGAAMTDEKLRESVVSDIVLLSLASIRMVVVHGGGPEINELLTKIGKQPRFKDGLRYTDEETMDVVQMVLAGKIGKDLAALAGSFGGKALSISGTDGGMLSANKISDEYGLVGEIQSVNPEIINVALDNGYIPIISTVALSDGRDGQNVRTLNINADTAAGAIAVALKAERLILLTDVRGILDDPTDESTLHTELSVSEIPRLIKRGVISGGMLPKIECCVEAIRRGVYRAHILDGRTPHSILMEMLTDGGVGSMITN